MTSGNNKLPLIRQATLADLDALKRLIDQHRTELGFVLRASLEKSISEQELLVAVRDGGLVGLVHYHHRRDQQTTLYHLVVDERMRRSGIGRELIEKLQNESRSNGKVYILLKCPVPLSANEFYRRVGFTLERTDPGKERSLNVWKYLLK